MSLAQWGKLEKLEKDFKIRKPFTAKCIYFTTPTCLLSAGNMKLVWSWNSLIIIKTFNKVLTISWVPFVQLTFFLNCFKLKLSWLVRLITEQ